ncbi:hypothetical protein KSC_110670 [Ktedonobacter sp. SOSP1-52]|uniref:FAD-dependent oxidoreductase n=1 Tax=Ktedonobacter sp. SOSP1-52 TaxID=2778366 RepID=UPI001915FFEC|nr:FAD-dependent oxidoreductase [Ktedonobacter sp. SOSP1-52]GHO72175.1 hypothetical protein KSC_110670 [Ktedonobacter sp. SOSP1-52]
MRVLILGGAPAGVTAALQARELQAEVILIESKRVDGTSINEGPAPVRTLACTARLLRDSRAWDPFGLRGAPPRVNLAAVLAKARRIEEVAELQLAYPTVTEGVGMAAQKIVRELGVAPLPQLWATMIS